MRINNTQPYNQGSQKNKTISHKGAREFVRTLANPNALTPTVILETAVTGGRGYNEYKRSGLLGLRERATDDILAAVFWMKGVDFFNGIGDFIGKNFLGLQTTEFDVGKDALRTPLENLQKTLTEGITDPKKINAIKNKYTGFKFTKIILSTILSTAFVGFALPKINQGITKLIVSKDTAKKTKEPNQTKLFGAVTIDDFEKQITKNHSTSFKGLKLDLATIAHALENNKICKLLSSDVGITSGRVLTARDIDEGIEFGVRDILSCFFYTASTPLIYTGLQALTKSKAITAIDPVAAKQVTDHIAEQLQAAGGQMSTKDFVEKVLGQLTQEAKTKIDSLPFNKDVIPFQALEDANIGETLLNKAREMAKLQPEQATHKAVLTRQQVEDVFKQGSINTPEFMMKLYKEHFGDKLTDANRFIPMKDITVFRDNIENYIKAIIEKADSAQNGNVTKELIEKVSKKGFAMSAGFRAIAIGISALALGVAIPKLQHAITRYRTGSNAAPGLREYQQTEANKA